MFSFVSEVYRGEILLFLLIEFYIKTLFNKINAHTHQRMKNRLIFNLFQTIYRLYTNHMYIYKHCKSLNPYYFVVSLSQRRLHDLE